MLYTERHKNLLPYRIGRGSITRLERNDDGVEFHKRYVVGDVILLTEAGAQALHGNALQLTTRAGAGEVVTKSIKVPKDWRDMRKPDLLALAATIADRPMKKIAEAVFVIEEHLEAVNAAGDPDAD